MEQNDFEWLKEKLGWQPRDWQIRAWEGSVAIRGGRRIGKDQFLIHRALAAAKEGKCVHVLGPQWALESFWEDLAHEAERLSPIPTLGTRQIDFPDDGIIRKVQLGLERPDLLVVTENLPSMQDIVYLLADQIVFAFTPSADPVGEKNQRRVRAQVLSSGGIELGIPRHLLTDEIRRLFDQMGHDTYKREVMGMFVDD